MRYDKHHRLPLRYLRPSSVQATLSGYPLWEVFLPPRSARGWFSTSTATLHCRQREGCTWKSKRFPTLSNALLKLDNVSPCHGHRDNMGECVMWDSVSGVLLHGCDLAISNSNIKFRYFWFCFLPNPMQSRMYPSLILTIPRKTAHGWPSDWQWFTRGTVPVRFGLILHNI